MRVPSVLRSIATATCLVAICVGTGARAQWGGGESSWENILDHPDEFYGTAESVRVADNVLAYQHDNGGWPKNIEMTRKLTDSARAQLRTKRNRYETLIDNGATYTQIRFLALVHAATGQARFADAARRGIEYLLAAQYPNGGWPMVYPIRPGYYQHITFNDGAMIGVMRLLRDAAGGASPFEFVDDQTRARCRAAVDRGLDVILKCQVVVDGRLTAWCAQHDEVDFHPQAARTYELPSLSGYESVGIVDYLLEIEPPSPAVRAAVAGAIQWLSEVKLEGLAVRWKRDPKSGRPVDRLIVDDPAGEPLWARFYEIGTNRPMYVGRDGIVHEQLSEIERERRLGYAWIGDWPRDLLEKKYPAWRQKWGDP